MIQTSEAHQDYEQEKKKNRIWVTNKLFMNSNYVE